MGQHKANRSLCQRHAGSKKLIFSDFLCTFFRRNKYSNSAHRLHDGQLMLFFLHSMLELVKFIALLEL